MSLRKGWRSKVICCLYDNPFLNEKLCIMRRSYEEMYKILNPKPKC